MSWKVPLFEIYWDDDDINEVNKIIKSGSFWAEGKAISDFEELLKEFFGVEYAVVMNSGTSAQTSILNGYDIRNGAEVIVPSFTFISTANCVLHTNAKPVFADIEEQRMGLDPNSVLEKINDKTKAIIPVHYAGNSCEIKALSQIADDHNLKLIEDNAESMGATFNNIKLGTYGDATFLSFCQNKIITTGEGGAVITNEKRLYDEILLDRSHGRSSANYFGSNSKPEYIKAGFNYRMPTMNAALGIAQMNKIDKLINLRQKAASKYIDGLSKIDGISVQPLAKNNEHVYQLFPIIVDDCEKRDYLMNALKEDGIFSKVYFDPIHHAYLYKKVLNYDDNLKVTEDISRRILNIPIFPSIRVEQINLVINSIVNHMS